MCGIGKGFELTSKDYFAAVQKLTSILLSCHIMFMNGLTAVFEAIALFTAEIWQPRYLI